MSELFITKIKSQNCPIVGDIEIPLDEAQRKHLIITGKNGSGKTTFLKELDKQFQRLLNNSPNIFQLKQTIEEYKQLIHSSKPQIEAIKTESYQNESNQFKILTVSPREDSIEYYEKQILEIQQAQLFFSGDYGDLLTKIKEGDFLLANFEAKRENKPHIPTAIQKADLEIGNTTETKTLHTRFIEYMVRLRVTYLDAKDEVENNNNQESREKAQEIKEWFNHFEKTLRELFEKPELKLKYDNENLNYKIIYEDRNFGLNELSDGYSSLIAVLAELILRMEAKGFKSYDMQGVVLLDEIETHLHIALQKKVLPFLCNFFPKIQFIVTTHSPFVLSSLENAVICDLERRIITEDLSAYSYDALIESYFDDDKYSQELKNKVEKYEALSKKIRLTEIEEREKEGLRKYLKEAPTFMAQELEAKLNEIRLFNLTKGEK